MGITAGKHVVVIGAGIVGTSSALYAQRRGHRVSIIDPRGFAGGASSGNAGVIAVSECVPVGTPELLRRLPPLLFRRDSPLTMVWPYAPRLLPWLYRFLRSCAPSRLEPAMAALASLLSQASVHHYDLAVMSRCAHMLSKPGWLKVFETDDAYTAAKPDIERMRRHGVECRYLDSDEIGAAQPNFNPIFKHAILHPECEQIADPQAYVAAYGEEFVRRGGALIRAEVVSLESRGGMIKAACSHTEKYEGDVFVIAAGAWSSRLSREAATRVCLDTERGYHIVVSGSAERLASSPVLWAEHAIVMSPSQAGLRVTSSVEFAGLEHKPDFRKLRRLIPQIGRAHAQPLGGVVSEWLGFRPSTPDSLPVIGHAAGAENGFLAFGHGHLGLTLGPVTGAVIADLIDGRQPCIDISPFTADRFYRA